MDVQVQRWMQEADPGRVIDWRKNDYYSNYMRTVSEVQHREEREERQENKGKLY